MVGSDIPNTEEVSKDKPTVILYRSLYIAMNEKAKSQTEFAISKEMINRMGYYRRDKDVKEIEEMLTGE